MYAKFRRCSFDVREHLHLLAYQVRQSMPRMLVCVVILVVPPRVGENQNLMACLCHNRRLYAPVFHLLLGLQDLKGEEAWPWKILLTMMYV